MAALDDILSKILDMAQRMDGEFKESDHPRDNDGKWTSGGGGAKLTPTEKTYLSSYSGDDFLRINKELRAGKTSDPAVKNLDTAIAKSKVPVKTLYRGMTTESAKKLFPGGEIKKGETISDPAFLSTSKSAGEAHARGLGGVVLKIEANENASGLDMSEHSRNKSEEEVLLPRNAKLTVIGITPPKSTGDPVIVRVAYGDSVRMDSMPSEYGWWRAK
jgi:ADP-ribosyltransferase exoenzyme